MKNVKIKVILSVFMIFVTLFSSSLTTLAASQLTTYYAIVGIRESTDSFYCSSGTIYVYNNTKPDKYYDGNLRLKLYSVENGVVYSYITISLPAAGQTKSSTLHWDYVPSGNYFIGFEYVPNDPSSTVYPSISVWGQVFDGPQ